MCAHLSGPGSLCRNAQARLSNTGSLGFHNATTGKGQSMDLEVVIEGVSDPVVADGIARQIRQVCKENQRPGQWSLTVCPSETRGQWDLGVRGPFGRHFASFTDHVDQLPGLVAAHLLGCL